MNWLSIAVILLASSFENVWTDPIDKTENANRLAMCGKVTQSKVYKGAVAKQTESPWTVLVQIRLATTAGWCTGTIISPRHILTATHCFFNENNMGPNGFQKLKVGQRNDQNCEGENYVIKEEGLLKTVNIISEDKTKSPISKFPEKITLIKACESKTVASGEQAKLVFDDVAIIHLYEDLTFSPTVHPACVPTNRDGEKDGTELQYFGFGNSYSADDVSRDVVEDTVGVLRSEVINVITVNGYRNHLFFAKNSQQKTMACMGDSGGGSWRKDPDNNDRATVIGVLSMSSCETPNGRWGDPAKTVELYTSAAFHMDAVCKDTGVCKDDTEHTTKLSGYVKKAKPVRVLSTDPPLAVSGRPRVGGNNNNNKDEDEDDDKDRRNAGGQAHYLEEPDGANVSALSFALLISVFLL